MVPVKFALARTVYVVSRACIIKKHSNIFILYNLIKLHNLFDCNFKNLNKIVNKDRNVTHRLRFRVFKCFKILIIKSVIKQLYIFFIPLYRELVHISALHYTRINKYNNCAWIIIN